MLFQSDVIFLDHSTKKGDNKDFHSVSVLDMGGIYRKFGFVGNVSDFDNLNQNDSCVGIFKVRFGREKESYIIKGIDVISIKKK